MKRRRLEGLVRNSEALMRWEGVPKHLIAIAASNITAAFGYVSWLSAKKLADPRSTYFEHLACRYNPKPAVRPENTTTTTDAMLSGGSGMSSSSSRRCDPLLHPAATTPETETAFLGSRDHLLTPPLVIEADDVSPNSRMSEKLHTSAAL